MRAKRLRERQTYRKLFADLSYGVLPEPGQGTVGRQMPVIEDHITPARASKRQRWFLFALFVILATAGALRLNTLDLFNPDSPRYVLYGQSLVETGSYRMIDSPDQRLYTWRPPGLSLLVAPALALRPLDTVAAKGVVLAITLLLLGLVYAAVRQQAGNIAALIVAAVFASSPWTLVLGTEVLTEVPYAACSLAVLWLLARDSTRRSPGVLLGVALLLAFLPLIRTVGVALLAAIGVWALSARARWKWIPVVLVAAMGLGVWSWRNSHAGGPNYAGSVLSDLSSSGFVAAGVKLGSAAMFYLKAMGGLLLPGLTRERPAYAPLLVDAVPVFTEWQMLAALGAVVMIGLAAWGMWLRSGRGGGLALLYVLIYGACLTVWPWRHERFVWPLVPLVGVYLPVAVQRLWSLFRNRGRGLIAVPACCMCLALVIWQGFISTQLIRANRACVTQPDRFYAEAAPGFSYCDWQAAGRWIRTHTAADARVLTRHAAVAITAHRYQKVVMFEATSPDVLHRHIAQFAAQYLVVPTAQFGDGISWTQLERDPVYRFEPVYEARDVMVLQIEPNRTGKPGTIGPAVGERLAACERSVARHPGRSDLKIRLATLLNEAGRRDQAIELLQGLIADGIDGVRINSDLGWMLFAAGRYDEAARYLTAAAALPDAEAIADALRSGAAEARRRAERHRDQVGQPSTPQADGAS